MMMITILSPEINLLLLTIEKTWKSIAKIVMMAMTVMTMTMMAAIMILMIIKTSEMKIEPEQLTPP